MRTVHAMILSEGEDIPMVVEIDQLDDSSLEYPENATGRFVGPASSMPHEFKIKIDMSSPIYDCVQTGMKNGFRLQASDKAEKATSGL